MAAAIIGAVVSALLTGVLALIANAIWAVQSEDRQRISDMIDQIRLIEHLAIHYWCLKEHDDDLAPSAARLRGALHSLGAFEVHKAGLLKNRSKDFDAQADRLLEVCTGGCFEATERSPDYSRVVEIGVISREAVDILSICRRSLFWAR